MNQIQLTLQVVGSGPAKGAIVYQCECGNQLTHDQVADHLMAAHTNVVVPATGISAVHTHVPPSPDSQH